MIPVEPHKSSLVMLGLLVAFALVHSGGAAIRSRAESVIGPRAWRLIFAGVSIPSAIRRASVLLGLKRRRNVLP